LSSRHSRHCFQLPITTYKEGQVRGNSRSDFLKPFGSGAMLADCWRMAISGGWCVAGGATTTANRSNPQRHIDIGRPEGCECGTVGGWRQAIRAPSLHCRLFASLPPKRASRRCKQVRYQRCALWSILIESHHLVLPNQIKRSLMRSNSAKNKNQVEHRARNRRTHTCDSAGITRFSSGAKASANCPNFGLDISVLTSDTSRLEGITCLLCESDHRAATEQNSQAEWSEWAVWCSLKWKLSSCADLRL